MLHSPLGAPSAIAACLVCGFAIVTGTWRERMGGVVYLIGFVLNFLLGLALIKLGPLRFLIAGSVCLIGFFYLCWKSPHPWPLWAFAFQFISVMTAAAALFLGPSLLEWTFLAVERAVSYSVLIVLLIGTFAGLRSRKGEKSHK